MRFIRKHGRIIPIRDSGDGTREKVAGAGLAFGGAGIAANAANTKRVYENIKTGITIDRKAFDFTAKSMSFGTGLRLQKDGVQAATALYSRSAKGSSEFNTGWLSVKKAFRNQGLSSDIMKQATIEIRSLGGKTLWDHVVHPGSAKVGRDIAKSEYWKESKVLKDGFSNMVHVSEQTALKHVSQWAKDFRTKPGFFGRVAERVQNFAWSKGKASKMPTEAPAIFRHTVLPKFKRTFSPYYTTKTKVLMGVGLAAAAIGAGLYLYGRSKDKRK